MDVHAKDKNLPEQKLNVVILLTGQTKSAKQNYVSPLKIVDSKYSADALYYPKEKC